MSATRVAEPRCRGTYDALLQQCDQLEKLAAENDERLSYRARRISTWSVAEQLDHIARATQAMAGAIEEALRVEGPGGGRPSLVGRMVLFTGWIPRGVGKAPAFTRPAAASREQLGSLLAQSRQALDRLEARLPEIDGARGRVNHFAFGDLTPRQWLSAIEIHTRHHLKVIRDIQKARGSPWRG
ncbi:MAG: DinB family protein [Gemmatimonadota bacterium]|nr:MAG: DinB family protein [Gemmatimonadota bacterium]